MRNAEILACRVAKVTAPGLWAFAYPVHGRGLTWLRLAAFVLWRQLLRARLRSAGL